MPDGVTSLMPSRRARAFLRALDAADHSIALQRLARAAARALGARAVRLRVVAEGIEYVVAWPARPALGPMPHAARLEGGSIEWRSASKSMAGPEAIRHALELLATALAGWRQAQRCAGKDPLTALPNRLALEPALAQCGREAQRYGAPLAVAVADVNGLGAWNDRYGHLAGDRALRRIARALRRGCRAADIVGRWGGDEFVVVMPRTDRRGAEVLAARLAAACPPPGITIGTAALSEVGRGSVRALWRLADRRLRAAKRTRRRSGAEAVQA